MKAAFRKVRQKIIVLCCCVALIVGLLTGCGGSGGAGGSGTGQSGVKTGETARTIVVEETNGTTIVLDEAKESTNAYRGMHLFSGNDVTVHEISDLTMLLDMDKYLYAEESTHFWMEASGSQENSQTVIYMDEGATLNRIVNPLEKGSVYQVNTPNSTMAVRGTVFRVKVRRGKDDKVYTDIAVLDGSVKVDLKTTEGEFNGETETIQAGEAASIRADDQTSEFIEDENGNTTSPVDYSAFPSGTLGQIINYIDDGEEIAADKEELEEVLEEVKAKEEEEKEKEKEEQHDWQTEIVRQADCIHEGLEQSVCSICGEVKDQRTIPVTEHKASAEWTTQKEATCTEDGLQVRTCTVCGKVVDSRKIKALKHKPGDAVVTEPTCTEPGMSTVLCLLCGHTIEEHIKEALGHSPGEWVVVSPAGYGVEGSQSQYCTVCGQLLGTQTIPALIPEPEPPQEEACKHEVEWSETKPATCLADGSRSGTCTLCGETVTEVIKTSGHDWGEWSEIPATCTADEKQIRECSICGDIQSEVIKDTKLEHTWSAWSKPENCTAAGKQTRLCQRESCTASETKDVEIQSAHEWGEWNTTVEATCYSVGTRIRYCSNCAQTDKEDIAMLEHTWSEWSVLLDDCTKGGSKIRNCAICKATDTETINAAEHTYVWKVTKEATCTEDGWEVECCSKCGKNSGKQQYIAKGHVPGDPVEEEPTCTEKGRTVVYCTICKEVLSVTEHEDQPALGHTLDGADYKETEEPVSEGSEETQKVKSAICGRVGCNQVVETYIWKIVEEVETVVKWGWELLHSIFNPQK